MANPEKVVPPTNGTAKVLTVVPVATIPPKPADPKAEKENEKLLPLDERLQRIHELFSLETKYSRLQESKKKLCDFKLKEGETITLRLSDSNSRGDDFSTSNPEVIKAVMNCLKTTIDEKIKAISPLLKW